MDLEKEPAPESEAPPAGDAPPLTADPAPAAPTHEPQFATSLASIWDRIKHHKVVQWTLAYLAVAYTLLHGAEMLSGSLGWPHGWIRVFTLLLILGVPIVITLAWYHGARGLQRASGTEVMIIAILLAIGGLFLWRDGEKAHDESIPASDVAADKAVAITTQPHGKSIAVLPFADMSPGKDQEYMSYGMAEEILNLLTQAPDLKVIARTSSFAFQDKGIPVAEIARQLNVAYVLEGSVRTSGNQMRITAQLIRAADNTHLWSEKYDRPLQDIFTVQDEIASAIVQALQIKLMGGSLSRREGGTQNLEAYQLYLRARQGIFENTRASLDAAEQYARRAVEIDPAFGKGWEALSHAAVVKIDSGFVTSAEGFERSREYVLHALEISPGLATARGILGYILSTHDWDWAAADAQFKEALALDPTDTIVLNNAGWTKASRGRWDEAERYFTTGLARDPLQPFLLWNLGHVYYLARRFEDSERIYRQLLASTPDFGWTRGYLGKTLLALGRAQEGLKLADEDREPLNRITFLPILLQAAGRQAEADAALASQIELLGDVFPYYVALTFAYRGEHDRALEWLERAYAMRDPMLVEIVGEPIFDAMANDPRYRAFLRKMNLPETTPPASH